MGVSRADNSLKIWRNLPISNPKPDIHNINAHTKFGENPLMFTQVIIRKRKPEGRTYDGRTDRPVVGLIYGFWQMYVKLGCNEIHMIQCFEFIPK